MDLRTKVTNYVSRVLLALSKVSLLDGAVSRMQVTGHPEPIDIGGNDELHTLSVNAVAMVTALESARSEVEARVEEATADLRRALEDLRAETASREAAERERQASESKYRVLIDNLQDVVLTLAADGHIGYASPSAGRVFGLEPELLVGMPIDTVLEHESARHLRHALARGLTIGATPLALEAVTAEGNSLDIEVALMPLADTSGEIQAIVRDVTARKRHESELLHIASHDFLTGMLNRRRFEEELQREIAHAERRDGSGAVLWLDLDDFKDVNDTLGHHAGDELLIAIGGRLAQVARAESIVARIGGDEFAILLPGADRAEAEGAAERLITEIGQVSVEIEGRVTRSTASVGVVAYPEHGMEVEDLLARADMAMYRAKELGRARYQVFDETEGWQAHIEDGQVWAEMLQGALAEGNLQVFAQPITSMAGAGIVRYELLVRMSDLDGGPIPPARFLPVAERTGLIVDVDLWMLSEAIRILEASPHHRFGLSVNASPRTIRDERFLRELTRQVEASSIDPGRLTIEITETAILIDVAKVKDTLWRIRQLGCRVALDDFGSGFTSFLHLKQLPIDDIKIDGSFVLGMRENENDRHLVRAMVEMSRGLNMTTTAEFVESAESLVALELLGVDMVQGYAIGRPSSAWEMLTASDLLTLEVPVQMPMQMPTHMPASA